MPPLFFVDTFLGVSVSLSASGSACQNSTQRKKCAIRSLYKTLLQVEHGSHICYQWEKPEHHDMPAKP